MIPLDLIAHIKFCEKYNEASHKAIFFNVLSPPPSYAQILSSAPSSQLLSAYVLPVMREM